MGTKILIVDDDPLCQKVIGTYLRRGGYEVLEAYSGKKALAIFKKEDVALVLLDILMPGMNGLETLRRMKEINSQMPVIVLSGLKDVAEAKLVMQSGAVDYLTKPVDFEYLDESLTANLL